VKGHTLPNTTRSKNKAGGYHRIDGHHRTERSKVVAEDRLNRLKGSVNAGRDAFFARHGIAYKWGW
jgi:hypothetical protein